MRFLDLFCGCGGTSEGFRQAGWVPDGALDCDARAVATYALNFPRTTTLCADVRDPDVQDRLVARFGGGQVDVVFGSPPCQGFSSRNTQTTHNTAKYEALNELPVVFAHLAVRLGPKAILMEEVSRAAVLAPRLKQIFQDAGYDTVCHAVVDAARHGVPQHRKRFVLVACASDKVEHTPLMAEPEVTAREALTQLPVPPYGRVVTERVRERILEWDEKGRQAGQYAVMNLDKPARTVHTQTLSSTGPYTIKRGDVYHELSVLEAARLQTFPPDFQFHGPVTTVRKQIGNAVPPTLARKIAQSLVFLPPRDAQKALVQL